MFLTFVRKTCFANFFVSSLLLMLAPALVAQKPDGDTPRVDQVFVHFDVGKLGESQTGKMLFDSLYKIPYVKKQLSSIPENLQFLTDAKCQSITLQVSGSQKQQTAVLEVVCELDEQKLVGLLANANGYAKVQSNGIDIHHWVTDFETLGNQFMGQAESSWSDEKPDSVFLAMPSENRFFVTTSLASLTELLAVANPSLAKPTAFTEFEKGDELVSVYMNVDGDEVPGELAVVVRESASGRLGIHAALKSRNPAEKQFAALMASYLQNPKATTQMLGLEAKINQAKADQTDGEKLAGEQLDDEEKPLEMMTEAKADQSNHDMNRLSFGLQMNSASMEPGDWDGMIERFLVDCVQCRHEKETLTLDVNAFIGPCRILNVARDSKEGIKRGLDYNIMQVFFNVYSTENERQAAMRIAEKQATELKRR